TNFSPGLGLEHAFVSKLNFSGSTLKLAYSTYLSNVGPDAGNGIAVDKLGNAYVVGITEEDNADFPSVNPLPPGQAGGGIFVSKLTFSNSKLTLAYATQLGGNNFEGHLLDLGKAICVDESGNAYITGITFGSNFPQINPLPPAVSMLSGNGSAFISKLTFSNGNELRLAFSTFLGDSNLVDNQASQSGTGIALDSSGNIYVAGDKAGHAFVDKLNFTGSTLSLDYDMKLAGGGVDTANSL